MSEGIDDRLALIDRRAGVIRWRRRLGAAGLASALALAAVPLATSLGDDDGGTIRAAEPSSTTARGGLRVSITADDPVVEVGQPVEVTVTVEDDAAGHARLAWAWEPGESLRFETEVGGCEGSAPRSGPYRAREPQRHTYEEPGTYEVRVLVHSVGCGVEDEKVTASLVVEVVEPKDEPSSGELGSTVVPSGSQIPR